MIRAEARDRSRTKAPVIREEARDRSEDIMDFEEELKKFEPSMEINEAEDAIYQRDMTDMMDVVQEILRETRI